MRDELGELEAEISHLRCRQHVLVNELDKVNAAAGDGYRSSVDWLSARLDVDRSTASDLVYAARWSKWHREVEDLLADGVISFDRTVAMLRLAVAGADRGVVDDSRRLDLAGVNRLTARQRRITRGDEHAVYADRFVSIQPTLDESLWHLTGQLPAMDGKIVEQALHARADELHTLPGGETCTRAQRQADSLVAMAHDSLDRCNDTGAASSGSSVSIFVDLGEANGTGGERGAALEYGPRVGPATLEELLCAGSVQIIGLDGGRPVVTSIASRAIPAALRRYRCAPRRRLCDRGLHLTISAPTPPHRAPRERRESRLRQPRHTLLVPPPHRRPPKRPQNRPRLATPETKTHPASDRHRPTRMRPENRDPDLASGRRPTAKRPKASTGRRRQLRILSRVSCLGSLSATQPPLQTSPSPRSPAPHHRG